MLHKWTIHSWFLYIFHKMNYRSFHPLIKSDRRRRGAVKLFRFLDLLTQSHACCVQSTDHPVCPLQSTNRPLMDRPSIANKMCPASLVTHSNSDNERHNSETVPSSSPAIITLFGLLHFVGRFIGRHRPHTSGGISPHLHIIDWQYPDGFCHPTNWAAQLGIAATTHRDWNVRR